MARIGVYGGSFNPPHRGHILAAQAAKAALGLDLVLVIPAAIPPHKALAEGSPDADTRLRLTELAFSDLVGFTVSDLELRRQGASYTVDTLRELHESYPRDELVLLMGTDMLLSFDTWREPDTICKLAALACFSRYDGGEQALAEKKAELERRFGATVTLIGNEAFAISSTEIRRLLVFGCAEAYLPERVLSEIEAAGLYGAGRDHRDLPYEELEALSLSLHKERRIPHVRGCVGLARTLAERFGENETLAARAAVLHDVTKALTDQQQTELCAAYGITLSAFDRTQPQLWHAITAAEVAARVFGECSEVCNAIRWHTTGKADMTRLEKILYIADLAEPTRAFPGVEAIRAALKDDLDAGVMLGMEHTVRYLTERGCAVAPESLEALDSLKGRRKQI